MRKVYVTAAVILLLNVDEGVEISDVISELEVISQSDKFDVEDYGWAEHKVMESK